MRSRLAVAAADGPMSGVAEALGLLRSLAIYRARPWRTARLAGFYRQFLKPGDLAFDIGAHAGNRALAMARAGARVVALEPQPLFFRLLLSTMPQAVMVLPLAAGAVRGRARLLISRRHPTLSTLAADFPGSVAARPGFSRVRWDGEAEVEQTTLDDLVANFGSPAFIKLDVEGFEAEVLAGLSRPVPFLAFEYLPAAPQRVAPVFERLAALGRYRFNLVRGEEARFLADDWYAAERMRNLLSTEPETARPLDIYARLTID
jgi:FkbM family methyltransferase